MAEKTLWLLRSNAAELPQALASSQEWGDMIETLQRRNLLTTAGPTDIRRSRITTHWSLAFPHLRVWLDSARDTHAVSGSVLLFLIASLFGLAILGPLVTSDRDQFAAVARQSVSAWSTVPILLLGVAIRVTVHEFGHFAIVRMNGGKSRFWGFGMYFGIPVAFCEANDSWETSKPRRLLADAGGILMEIALFGLVSLLMPVMSSSSLLARLGLLLLFIIPWSVITNLNPLLRRDGYWMLCDALDAPNLQKLAFRRIRFLLARNPSPPTHESLFGVPDRLVALYCVLVATGVLLMIGFFAHWITILVAEDDLSIQSVPALFVIMIGVIAANFGLKRFPHKVARFPQSHRE